MRSRFSKSQTMRLSSRFLLAIATATMLTACSDSLERFANYGSNPSDADPVYTASVPKAKATKVSRTVVQSDNEISSTDIDAPQVSQSKPKNLAFARGKPKLELDQQDVGVTVEENVATQDVIEEPVQRLKPVRKSTRVASGATVRVEPGMTMFSIARANNVSVGALAKANRIPPPYILAAGRELKIPGASSAVTPDVTVAQAPVSRTVKGGKYTVSSGDTLYSIGRKFGVSPFLIADANGLKKNTVLSVGQSLRVPGSKGVVVAKAIKTDDRVDDQSTDDQVLQPFAKPKILAPFEQPVADNSVEEPAQKLTLNTKPLVEETPAIAAGALTMRWPADGKVISEFGTKPGGLKNEGINISMPEGTPIRAAESGVVAYAGNELKGYGNLVLIRHEGGYVTAYAHAKELSVKRGDTVKRGAVIARAGQTGAVTTPQLHFEVRKGATAMDPLKFLGKATASN